MQNDNSPDALGRLKNKLAERAATALGLSREGALDLTVATLVTILEEYVEYQRREEGARDLEALGIREGIFRHEELAHVSAETRAEMHAGLRILNDLESIDGPRTDAWPDGLVQLVARLVAVVASQEASLALLRTEVTGLRAKRAEDETQDVGAPLVPLALLPAEPSEPPSIHSRQTLSSELAPYGGNRETVAEIETLVSYISALGAQHTLSLAALRGRGQK